MRLKSLPQYDFKDHVVVVTGAGQGMGRKIATRFADQGANVIAVDNNFEYIQQTASAIHAHGGTTELVQMDVTDAHQTKELFELVVERYGSIEILVNNAGLGATGIIEDVAMKDWQRVIDVNLTAPFMLSQLAIPIMRRNNGGKIINISSIAAKRLSSTQAASYTASKAGLIAFTRHLAYEVAPFGINVNALCPGPVDSPMQHKNGQDVVGERIKNVPAGRLTSTDDQAHAVMFLASGASSMINGVALDVDGGALLGWYDTATYYERRGLSLSELQAERQ